MMNTLCRVRLLGGLRVELDGREITRFRTRKTGALLAYLAFYRHRAHPREALIEILWPEDEQDLARLKLRQALHSLGRQLEPPGVPKGAVIVATRSTVQLNPAAVTTDVCEFEAALRVAAITRSEIEHVQRLVEAIDLYRGELLLGYYEDWLLQERERLAEAYLRAGGQLLIDLEQRGDLVHAVEHAWRMVAADLY